MLPFTVTPRRPSPMLAAALFVVAIVAVLSACEPDAEHLTIVADPTPDQMVPVAAGADRFADHRDVSYRSCHKGCDQHTLDIYLPDGPAVGTIVFFHGGGFSGGSKELVIVMGLIKSQTDRGWAVVAPNYRLADLNQPNSRSLMMADAAAALGWTSSTQAADLGLPTDSPRVVAGHSAGGTIAGLLASTTTDGSIDGWVSVSGVLDWEAGPMSNAAADTLHASPVHQSSPVDLFTKDTPAGYVIHGDQDDVVEWLNVLAAGSATLDTGAPNLTFDLVDHAADGASLGYARGHVPLGGANATSFNAWLDSRLNQ